jgi:hypothetical protein
VKRQRATDAQQPAKLDWRTIAAERDGSANIDAELVSCAQQARARAAAARVASWAVPSRRAQIASVRAAAFASALDPLKPLRPCLHCGVRSRAVQPVEGLEDQVECQNQRACERRIRRRLKAAA